LELFVVAVESKDDIESLFSGFILSGIKNTATDFKYEGIVIGGKTGRVVSAYTTGADGKRWHYRNIDIPLAKMHLNITYCEQPFLTIDEFNQILSTFKFSDQH
jgi:hypothetical protein